MAAEHLTDPQRAALAARVPHFDAERCSRFFGDGQPEDGLIRVASQGSFPGVRMANGVAWFHDRANRPQMDKANARGEFPPMKAKAPPGVRHLMAADLSEPELVVVEGEGHGLAVASVGYLGVVVAGGTNALITNRGSAPKMREGVFKGKKVRILFDTDEAGQKAASQVAAKILEAGAAKVAIVRPEWEAGQDVEDWLGTFPNADEALGALLGLLQKVDWETVETLREQNDEPETVPARSLRIGVEGLAQPVLVCTTWNPHTQRFALAVFGPEGLARGGERGFSVRHDQQGEPSLDGPWVWQECEEWRFGRQRFVPANDAEMLRRVKNTTLTLPSPPHRGEDTDATLFRDIEAFIKRWLALSDERLYPAMAAWAMLSWCIHDASYRCMPLLRISGPSGSGKGAAKRVLAQVCWSAFTGRTTADNLHWFVSTYPDVTQLFDEFHLGRGQTHDADARHVDTINTGYERGDELLRVVNSELRGFEVFGARALFGYSHDEEPSIARRTLVVPMSPDVEIPDSMQVPYMPDEFHTEGAALRARLLAWRGRKHLEGMPARDDYRALVKQADQKVADAYWPLLVTVPEELAEQREAIMALAEERAAAFKAARGADLTAFLLAEIATIVERGEALEQRDGKGWIIPTRQLVDAAKDPRATLTSVPQMLGERGVRLEHGEYRLARPDPHWGARPKGFRIGKEDPAVAGIMRRHGIEWPPQKDEQPTLRLGHEHLRVVSGGVPAL